jgi:hypothetical protein
LLLLFFFWDLVGGETLQFCKLLSKPLDSFFHYSPPYSPLLQCNEIATERDYLGEDPGVEPQS